MLPERPCHTQLPEIILTKSAQLPRIDYLDQKHNFLAFLLGVAKPLWTKAAGRRIGWELCNLQLMTSFCGDF